MKWLQLIYKLPAEPSRKRTYVWRQLRGLGAVYLQDGCCILPRTPSAETGFAEIAAKVREFGGDATLSTLGPAEPGWDEHMVATLNQARDEEYEELIDTIERFEEEIARETRKGKFTFAALEEIDDEYERLERWLERIRARDLCNASLASRAPEKCDGARVVREAYAEEVHRRIGANAEFPQSSPAPESVANESQSTHSEPEK